VGLQVDYVLEETDAVRIKQKLKCLPRDTTDAYRNVMERMTPGNQTFARRVLGWILHAQRILHMDELREALAVETGDSSLDREVIPSADKIIQSCGCLINHDQQNGLLTFSHETVRPFLERNELANIPSHFDLAKICLTYLGFSTLQNPCFNGDTPWDLAIATLLQRQVEFRFSQYASCFWAAHSAAASELGREADLEVIILRCFSLKSRRGTTEELRDPTFRHRHHHRLPYEPSSLLRFLIDGGLAFIFMSPLPHETSVASM
jgi:hypothetical protein